MMRSTMILVGILIVLVVAGGIWWYLDERTAEQERTRERLLGLLEEWTNGTIDLAPAEDCQVCGPSGCEPVGPCWKANITSPTEQGQILLSQEGGILGDTISSGSSNPDSGSGPPPSSCTYTYQTQSGNERTIYTNTGCANPLPTCSPAGSCTFCASQQDCLGVIARFSGSEPVTTTYDIISTPYQGLFTYATSRCVIDDSNIAIYDNATSPEGCAAVVASHVRCDEGLCDFI